MVTLGVACILMIAIVSFLVNGVVSTTKTTAINDATTKGRYVFEHMTKEMAEAADLNLPNFVGANLANPTFYSGFKYRITVGGPGSIIANVALSLQPAVLQMRFPPPNAADTLVPQADDQLLLPYPQSLATSGARIASVSPDLSHGGTPVADSNIPGNYLYTITLYDSIANLANVASSGGDVIPGQVGTVQ